MELEHVTDRLPPRRFGRLRALARAADAMPNDRIDDPAERIESPPPRAIVGGAVTTPRPYRALVLDDDEKWRKILHKSLTREGFIVDMATSPSEMAVAI